MAVQNSRIGSARIAMGVGIVAACLGLVIALPAPPVGAVIFVAALSIIGWASFIRLFHKIELRLIDIERKMTLGESGTDKASPVTPADNYL